MGVGRDLFLCFGSLHEDQGWTGEQGKSRNHSDVQTTLEAESSLKGEDFMVVAPQVQTSGACFLKKNVCKHLNRVCKVHEGGGRLLPPFLRVPFCIEDLEYTEYL